MCIMDPVFITGMYISISDIQNLVVKKLVKKCLHSRVKCHECAFLSVGTVVLEGNGEISTIYD